MKKWLPAFLAAQHVVVWSVASVLLNLGFGVWVAGVVLGLAAGVAAYSIYRMRHRPRYAVRR